MPRWFAALTSCRSNSFPLGETSPKPLEITKKNFTRPVGQLSISGSKESAGTRAMSRSIGSGIAAASG